MTENYINQKYKLTKKPKIMPTKNQADQNNKLTENQTAPKLHLSKTQLTKNRTDQKPYQLKTKLTKKTDQNQTGLKLN